MLLSKPFGIQRVKYYSKRQRKAWKKTLVKNKNLQNDFLGSYKHFVILIVLREQDTKKSYIEVSMVDIVIVRDCSLPVGQGSKNLMKHPCPEKSQSTCPSSSRSVLNLTKNA